MPEDTDTSDGRAQLRRRTLKSAKVWYNDYQSVMDCQVRDMSETGAKLRFVELFNCPDQVHLYFPYDEYQGYLRSCETKWVLGLEAGVAFTSDSQLVRLDELSKKRHLPDQTKYFD